jgi:ribonuclease HI
VNRAEERVLTIHVDGSMRRGPRKGGMGLLFVWVDEAGDEHRDAHTLPATENATNNQMELEAPSAALQIALRGRTPFDLGQFEKIVILSDSQYVCENVKNAMYMWPKTGWRTKDGPAVQNEDDWKTLLRLMQRMYKERRIRVSIDWERGKVSANAKAVDKLAKQSSASESFGRARPTNVRRKLTSRAVEPGIVRVTGQQLRIRIIEVRHLSREEGRYRYEVVDPSSPYDGKVDFAESALPLAPGHTYDARMNADQRNPRIAELIAEVEEDLTPYIDALRALGHPAAAIEVAAVITAATGVEVTPPIAMRRLKKLVLERGLAQVSHASSVGHPLLYELVSSAEPLPDDGAQQI